VATHWAVYSREGCHLCDELLADLARLLDPAEAARVAVIDITGDPDLERKYGQRVPVLLADGEFVCAYRLDVERVKGHLGAG
jgi:hypothetical protein